MGTATVSAPMAKAKGRPRKPSGEGTPVRLDSDVVSMARYLAAKKGTSLTKLLSDLLRPPIEREFKAAAKDLLKGGDN